MQNRVFDLLRSTLPFLLVAHPLVVAAHPTASEHLEDMRAIFSEMEGDAFWEVCKTVSHDIDVTLPKSFRIQFGPVPGNHRILGHSWGLGDRIPKDVLRVLGNAYPGREEDLVRWWDNYAKPTTDWISNQMGLPRNKATAFGNIVGRIHQLGDRTPDNILVDWVLPTRENAERMTRDIHTLFGNGTEVERLLREAIRGATETERAEAQLHALQAGRLSELLDNKFGPQLAEKGIHRAWAPPATNPSSGGPDLVHGAAGRLMCDGKTYSVNDVNGIKAWKGTCDNFAKQGKVQIRPGLLSADGDLLVATKTGGVAGFLVFAVDMGTACHRFRQGLIEETEFADQIVDAAEKGVAVGGSVAVAVMLGETPAGWVVLGVATVTYLIVDSAIRIWREIDECRYLREDDLIAFGIVPGSILAPRDTVLEFADGFPNASDTPLILL